ncbi:MAG TPA: hypothetical protein VJV23_17280 [Candidatus Polarisedimenticolia bacterium]|nr:hypothetical protein [Candidatus Polarisedimenticolia bacterium]
MTLPAPSLLAGPAARAGQAAADSLEGPAGGRIADSPLAWAAAAVLMVVALYFLIRLLEWDAMNKDTPNQEDPFH